ncbi:hypothetical protein E4U14_001626 [Claviceps sp. LM454 group G7]|nr:hypothetical protein E4U14_001626 [Claviceps sp. LM454 group G7]
MPPNEKKADAKTLGIILEGLSAHDAVVIDEYETASAVPAQLKRSADTYAKTSVPSANQYMANPSEDYFQSGIRDRWNGDEAETRRCTDEMSLQLIRT